MTMARDTMIRARAACVLLLAATILWAAPLLGLVAAGRPLLSYLEFPPRTRYVLHPSFEWDWFVALSLPIACVLTLYWLAIAHARPQAAAPRAQRPFPWWGWLGLGVVAASWLAAWHDGFLPPEWRRHVFTPLWLGYILAMNAVSFRRTGWALLTHRTGWFLTLFPVSGVFWWLFEHLNRFAANWYYGGVEASGDLDYFIQTTL